MPGMNGRDLAQRVRALRPGLRCLYMSGYTSDIIADHGVLAEGMTFVQKPFNGLELLAKVRAALDAASS
jgi:DNA-binding response OmpR family regulator